MATPHPSRPALAGLGLFLVTGPLALACSNNDFQVTSIQARMVASPTLTDFGAVPVGGMVYAQIDLEATERPVEVLAVEIQGEQAAWFSLVDGPLPVVSEAEPAELFVAYNPAEVGFHWAELHILTDEAEEWSEHVLQLRGQASEGSLRASPMVVDFGPVPTGQTETATVTLSNDGALDLRVDALTTTGAQADRFSAADLPLELPAGAEAELVLRFSAADQDSATAVGALELGGLAQLDGLILRANACETASSELYDQDGDGVSWCADDCDDQDVSVHPGATEICDGVDDDCDGTIDEGTSCYDDDGDGFTEEEGDCHDGDLALNPRATEIPANGIDDDCDGVVDDGATDADHDGWADTADDCDDGDDDVHPGAEERANGIDDDCDGLTDEGTHAYDDDGDGYSEDEGDCDDSEAGVAPFIPELADWLDQDCDGTVDEGTSNADDDGDGFSERGGDCDDADPTRNPGEYEASGDGVDSDCNGVDA